MALKTKSELKELINEKEGEAKRYYNIGINSYNNSYVSISETMFNTVEELKELEKEFENSISDFIDLPQCLLWFLRFWLIEYYKQTDMGKTNRIKVGTISQDQILKMDRANRRQEDIDARPLGGFTANHKVHKGDKTYTRKVKHKGREF